MNYTQKQIAKLVNGKCKNEADKNITSVTTDTRNIKPNSLFVALKGERFDGHNFAENAIENGAAAVLSQIPASSFKSKIPVIEVENTYDALLDLARGYRKSLNVKVVGVTGSVGKTTTKDMIAAVLSQGMNTAKTQENFNNHIGVPKTIFGIKQDAQAAVIEMGMNHFGEISKLTSVALPDIAVITCIGVSHIENLKSRENILKAKLEILQGMKENAPVVINADNDILGKIEKLENHKIIRTSITDNNADVNARNIVEGTEGIRFDIYLKNEYFSSVFLSAIGRHNIENAMLAAAVGIEMGLSELQIAAGLAAYVPSGMRQKITNINGITFIEDCYNASPTSMLASLSVLASIPDKKRKIAVLGDMLELGDISEEAHIEVGTAAGEKSDVLLCCGKFAGEFLKGASEGKCLAKSFETIEELSLYLSKNLKAGDCVLFKASHGMHFEKIISAVYNSLCKDNKGE